MGQIICNGTEVKTLIYNGTTIAEEGYTTAEYNAYAADHSYTNEQYISHVPSTVVVNNEFVTTSDSHSYAQNSKTFTITATGLYQVIANVTGNTYYDGSIYVNNVKWKDLKPSLIEQWTISFNKGDIILFHVGAGAAGESYLGYSMTSIEMYMILSY